MRALFRRLAPRIILALAVPMLAVEFLYGYIESRTLEGQLVEKVKDGGSQLSRSIISATWHAMRADRRQDAYEVMETMGRRTGIERIRLIDGEGNVTFTTGPAGGGRVGKDSVTCAVCHAGPGPLEHIEDPRRYRLFEGEDGKRRLGVVSAIYNEAACSSGACHAHPAARKVLGVLDITLPLARVDEDIASMRRATVLLGLAHVLILVLAVVAATQVLVVRPLRRLEEETRAISGMDLDRPVPPGGAAEIAGLAASVERMRLRLRAAVGAHEEARRSLEVKVAERGLRLEEAERRLIQSERLASLGRLSGVVAHEVNNPIAAVHTFSAAMKKMVDENGIRPDRVAEFRTCLDQVHRETGRVGRIVGDLLSFSRRRSPRIAESDLAAIVDRSLALVNHKLELSTVEARVRHDRALPPVPCDSVQVEQVALNLVLNGVEAMPGGGVLEIDTGPDPVGGFAVLEVRDGGVGIPEADRTHIFDPFFSTKSEGQGVGLGLAVVHGIVEAHGGTVEVEGRPGGGTTFRVRLPLSRREPGPGGAAGAGAAAGTGPGTGGGGP